jgi:dTDP-4-amino-4,6-dideoxygalactose transaminase
MQKGQISSYWIIESTPDLINLIETKSLNYGFQTLRWWQYGCHLMPLFTERHPTFLPETERIASSSIGLPFHLFLDEQAFESIFQAVNKILS